MIKTLTIPFPIRFQEKTVDSKKAKKEENGAEEEEEVDGEDEEIEGEDEDYDLPYPEEEDLDAEGNDHTWDTLRQLSH